MNKSKIFGYLEQYELTDKPLSYLSREKDGETLDTKALENYKSVNGYYRY